MIRFASATALALCLCFGTAYGFQSDSIRKAVAAPSWLHLQPVAVAEVFQNSIARWSVPIENRSAKSVSILDISSAWPGARGSAEPMTMPAGGRSIIKLEVPVEDSLGSRDFSFALRSSASEHSEVSLAVRAFVESAYLPERPALEFGNVHRGKKNEQVLTLHTMEANSLSLSNIIGKPDWLSLEVVARTAENPQELKLRGTLGADAPIGTLEHVVLLQTNVTAQPQLAVQITGNVFEDVIADPFPLWLGALKQKSEVIRELTLTVNDGTVLQIKSVSSPNQHLQFSHESCGKTCVTLRVRANTVERRKIEGEIALTFVGRTTTLRIPYAGTIVSENATVIDLGDLGKDVDITVNGRMNETP